MKAITAQLIALIFSASNALAAGGMPEGKGPGLLTSIFAAFFACIVLFQFIPCNRLLAEILKGNFDHRNNKPRIG